MSKVVIDLTAEPKILEIFPVTREDIESFFTTSKRISHALFLQWCKNKGKIETHQNVKIFDASGVDLTNIFTEPMQVDLRGFNLNRVNLSGAMLQNAMLSNCNLHEADLTSANLRESDCYGADFTGVKVDDKTLFQKAELRGIKNPHNELSFEGENFNAALYDSQLPILSPKHPPQPQKREKILPVTPKGRQNSFSKFIHHQQAIEQQQIVQQMNKDKLYSSLFLQPQLQPQLPWYEGRGGVIPPVWSRTPTPTPYPDSGNPRQRYWTRNYPPNNNPSPQR